MTHELAIQEELKYLHKLHPIILKLDDQNLRTKFLNSYSQTLEIRCDGFHPDGMFCNKEKYVCESCQDALGVLCRKRLHLEKQLEAFS